MQSQILPSRAALVDRIALQFEYGQNLIVLLGTSGLGKSYMLETFITDKYNDFNKAFVQVSAQMTDAQLMSELLEQVCQEVDAHQSRDEILSHFHGCECQLPYLRKFLYCAR